MTAGRLVRLKGLPLVALVLIGLSGCAAGRYWTKAGVSRTELARDDAPHQALENNCPRPRDVQPSGLGRVLAIPQVGGLHHHYQRAA